jgi:hypothetical protein
LRISSIFSIVNVLLVKPVFFSFIIKSSKLYYSR